ncbi:MAG: biosynthetic-type acetolactate synthase large subunit [Christensenellales bacterium]|jgi:acetolactate synthase-1/2/3 large subunit
MMLTGAQIIIEVLREQDVDTVFGYPGGYVINIYDELYKNSHRITHHITCHEQGAAHAADGYARSTGKPGVVIATSGPGATNLVTGIACAYFDSSPLVAITGNVPVNMLGRDSFQEVDIAGVTMPVTKHNYIVKDVGALAEILREAFQVAISGRPGPVLVDIPKDVQLDFCEYTPCGKSPRRPDPEASKSDIDAAVAVIKAAKRPYVYCGGGVVISGAEKELAAFADKIDAPIGSSMMGLSAVNSENPRFLGMMGMHGRYASTKALNECDLLIAVGTRFSDRATGDKEKFSKGRTILHIDIDPAEISKNITVGKSVVGNIKQVLSTLLENLEQAERPEWMGRMAELKESPFNSIDMAKDELTPQHIIEGVNALMAPEDIISTDVGQHQMWTTLYYRFRRPRTFMTSGGLGAMGFGMGAAIGASTANGKRRTVLFTSDGSFHMNLNEMATAVSNELPLIVVVINNGALGMVRQWQKLFFDGRYSHTTLERKTDYVKLAESFGAKGGRAFTPAEFDACVREAFSLKTPYLIDCVISSDQQVLPMIPSGKGIDDIILTSP